jgi:hypothetical protein
MYKPVIDQTSSRRIIGDIFYLAAEILYIANSMLVETALPHLPGELLPDQKREATLNTLNAPFDGVPVSRSQDDMQMFRHDSKRVEQKSSLFPISRNGLHHELRVRGPEKDRLPFGGHGGDGVGIDGRSRLSSRKTYLRG